MATATIGANHDDAVAAHLRAAWTAALA
jgi:hypothetical protein